MNNTMSTTVQGSVKTVSSMINGTEDVSVEVEWLEAEILGMRIWQFVGIILSVVLALTITICCCVKFRIPRTKQEIEADYVRKRLTRSFRKELANINDKDMDEMDLRRALDCVRHALESADTDETLTPEQKIIRNRADIRLGTKFNSMFQGMRVRFNKDEATEFNAMI